MKRYFDELLIDKPYISVFASGNSINDFSPSDILEIKDKSFLITMNYAPVKIIGHMNVWSDVHVTKWLNAFYLSNEKNNLFLAREKAMRNGNEPIYGKVDYWFDEKKENLKGNFTIVWLLQLFEKYFPDKKVLLFGLDMSGLNNTNAKWYDEHTTFDQVHRGSAYNIHHKLVQCSRQLDTYVRNKENFINCNMQSQYGGFLKRDWKDVVTNEMNSSEHVEIKT